MAISTSAQSIAERVMGWSGTPRSSTSRGSPPAARGRSTPTSSTSYVGDWIAERDLDEVVAAFEAAQAAVAPIYDIADVFADPQYRALDTITTVEDPVLGPVRMQNVLYRLSETPGSHPWTGRPHGADNAYGARRAPRPHAPTQLAGLAAEQA